MSEKISQMPAATVMGDADLIPIVQGGVNKSVIREIFLTGAPGFDIFMEGNDGTQMILGQGGTGGFNLEPGYEWTVNDPTQLYFVKDSFGNVVVQCAPGKTVTIGDTVSQFTFGGGGGFNLIAPSGQVVFLSANGASINLDGSGGVQIQVNGGQNFSLAGNGASININLVGDVSISPNTGRVLSLSYTPGNAFNWSGAPATVADALDRIADAVVNGRTGPIT